MRPTLFQHPARERTRIRLVVDDQNPQAMKREIVDFPGPCCLEKGIHWEGLRTCERQTNREGRALAFAIAVCLDRALMHLHEASDDREAQPEATVPAGRGGVPLSEA